MKGVITFYAILILGGIFMFARTMVNGNNAIAEKKLVLAEALDNGVKEHVKYIKESDESHRLPQLYYDTYNNFFKETQ